MAGFVTAHDVRAIKGRKEPASPLYEQDGDSLFRTLMTDEGCDLETAIVFWQCALTLVKAS